MVKQFLPGMISRKNGRIVAVASIGTKGPMPFTVSYTTTKYGIDGFMESLYDDICADECDEFIKLSTIYPHFMNTRKELTDFLDVVAGTVPRMNPKHAADIAVKNILIGKRHIVVQPFPIPVHTIVK